MLKHTTKFFTLLILFANSYLATAAGVLEQYVVMTVKDPGTVVVAMSNWFDSKESHVGQTVSLYRTIAGGANPGTHLILARFPDYSSWETLANRKAKSNAWADMVSSLDAVSKTHANGLNVEKAVYGSGGNSHKYVWAVLITVTNNDKFMKAFDRYQNSATGKQRPGEARLLQNRAGDAAEAFIIVETADSFTALNNYHDLREGSDDFARFQRDAGSTYKTNTTELYQRVKTWKQ